MNKIEIGNILQLLIDHIDLSAEQMTAVMRFIMSGEATAAQIAGILVALRIKGETVTEIVAAVRVMRELMVQVPLAVANPIDSCGTGGDGKKLFNVSTAAAFIAAAGGAHVAKHGNRAASGNSGSADVLEALGAAVDLSVENVSRCIEELGVGFMFAPKHHGAVRHAGAARRELGVRTLFNLLGPMCNPAGVRRQLLGVYSAHLLHTVVEVLNELQSQRVLAVASKDGLDEISCADATEVVELNDGKISDYTIDPADFGLQRHALTTLVADTPADSARLLREGLAAQNDAAATILMLNGGACLYAAAVCDDLGAGIALAGDLIYSGQALEKMSQFVEFTHTLSQLQAAAT